MFVSPKKILFYFYFRELIFQNYNFTVASDKYLNKTKDFNNVLCIRGISQAITAPSEPIKSYNYTDYLKLSL